MILQCYSALLLLKLKELLITEILPLHWYQLSRNCKNKRKSNIAYTGSTVSVQTGALQSRHLVTLRKLAKTITTLTKIYFLFKRKYITSIRQTYRTDLKTFSIKCVLVGAP